MKKIMILMLLIPFCFIEAQKIGKLAPEKVPEIFPDNSWGIDVMFGEGGFGIGTFYRKALSKDLTGFIDFSISESKDEKEVELIDYFGNTFTPFKKNRVFLLPLNFGVQYRLFSKELSDNLRPYINLGVGPTMVVTNPYDIDFFKSFNKAHANYAAGGYIGLGAYFGTNKSKLIGINLRYYIVHLFGKGIENISQKFRKDLNSFYVTINIGIMY